MKKQLKNGKLNKAEPIRPNLDNMRLLVSFPEFRNRVAEIRKHLGIPAEGFSNDTWAKKWNRKAEQDSDMISESEDFISKDRAIIAELKDGKISRQQAREKGYALYLRLPINYLSHSVKEIMTEFNVPGHYEYYVRLFIERGTINAPKNNFTIGPYQARQSLREARSVPITAYAKLNDIDLAEIKKAVNECFGKNLPFIQKVRSVRQKIEIEELYLHGEDTDAVTGKTYRLKNEDIAERVWRNPGMKDQVYETARNLQTIRKRRFKKSGKP